MNEAFDLSPFQRAPYFNFDMPLLEEDPPFMKMLSLDYDTVTLEAPLSDEAYITSLIAAKGIKHDFAITVPGEDEQGDWLIEWKGFIREVNRLDKGMVQAKIYMERPEGYGSFEPPEPFWRRWNPLRKMADFLGGR